MGSVSTQKELAARFRRLHHRPEILVLVNAWDVASARAMAGVLGCEAIATASHSIAAAHGYEDGENIPRDLMLTAIGRIAAAVDLPVTADLESGYGDVPGTVSAAVRLGAVGGNIEDAMCPLQEAVRAVEAAVDAGRGSEFVLNARTDAYVRDWPGRSSPGAALREAVRRGTAFLEAGADCVFVPGCNARDDIEELVAAFGPGRLSLLGTPGQLAPRELEALGVARISYGPFPQRWALEALTDRATALMRDRAADATREQGDEK